MFFPEGRSIAFVPSEDSFDQNVIDLWSKAGNEFLKAVGTDRNCVILTGVPTPNYATSALASGLGKQMGVAVMNVSVPAMKTFDGAHLDGDTAERWSKAFIDRADLIIERCLSKRGAADGSTAALHPINSDRGLRARHCFLCGSVVSLIGQSSYLSYGDIDRCQKRVR